MVFKNSILSDPSLNLKIKVRKRKEKPYEDIFKGKKTGTEGEVEEKKITS